MTAIGTSRNGVVKATSLRVGDTGLPAQGNGQRFGPQGGNGGAQPTP